MLLRLVLVILYDIYILVVIVVGMFVVDIGTALAWFILASASGR